MRSHGRSRTTRRHLWGSVRPPADHGSARQVSTPRPQPAGRPHVKEAQPEQRAHQHESPCRDAGYDAACRHAANRATGPPAIPSPQPRRSLRPARIVPEDVHRHRSTSRPRSVPSGRAPGIGRGHILLVRQTEQQAVATARGGIKRRGQALAVGAVRRSRRHDRDHLPQGAPQMVQLPAYQPLACGNAATCHASCWSLVLARAYPTCLRPLPKVRKIGWHCSTPIQPGCRTGEHARHRVSMQAETLLSPSAQCDRPLSRETAPAIVRFPPPSPLDREMPGVRTDSIRLTVCPPLHHVTFWCINRFQPASPDRQAKMRRRKDDSSVGTTADALSLDLLQFVGG